MADVQLTAIALPGIPLIEPGDDLASIIVNGLDRAGLRLLAGDALVITSKIVSKSEGRIFNLQEVQPSSQAVEVARDTRKDPRIVELVLRESRMISRHAPNVLVTQHRLGFVSANSGIDQSNVGLGEDVVLLLPVDPDESAHRIRTQLGHLTGVEPGVVISDSHGRPFRMGNIGVAIGVAGMPALVDLRGRPDLFGRELKISIQGYADMVASTANLLTGEADEGRPIVLLRGLNYPAQNGRAVDLYRSPEHDLYR